MYKQLQCLTFQTPCTVKHVLIERGAFAFIRRRFFNVNITKFQFESVIIDDIPFFLKEMKFHNKHRCKFDQYHSKYLPHQKKGKPQRC